MRQELVEAKNTKMESFRELWSIDVGKNAKQEQRKQKSSKWLANSSLKGSSNQVPGRRKVEARANRGGRAAAEGRGREKRSKP